MYCDRCGQVDESIAISALRSLDSGPQFSQSVGGIIHDGDYTPYMSTSVSRDSGLINLQVAAGKYASLEGLLEERGVTKSKAEVLRSAEYWKLIAPILLGVVLFFAGIAVKPFAYYNENSMFSLFMTFLGLACFGLFIRALLRTAKKNVVEVQSKITPEIKALAARRSRGSYCKRCNVFSPAHD